MKPLLLSTALIASLLITGCSSGMKRSNYRLLDSSESIDPNARVVIHSNSTLKPEDVEVLGQISAFDTGFAVKCSEAYVLQRFCNEARALGADVVNITEEKQPDAWSSCYRAKAEFLRLKDRTMVKRLKPDIEYETLWVRDRTARASEENRERMRAAIIGGAIGGAAGAAVGAAAAGR